MPAFSSYGPIASPPKTGPAVNDRPTSRVARLHHRLCSLHSVRPTGHSQALSAPPDASIFAPMSVSDFLAEVAHNAEGSSQRERLAVHSAIRDRLCSPPTRPDTAPSARRRTTSRAARSASATGQREPRQCLRAATAPSPNVLTAAETCQLLGSHMCSHCDSGNRRLRELDRSRAAFNGLEVSAENFSSALLLQRHLPALSTQELLARVANGDVDKDLFLRSLRRRRQEAKEAAERQRRAPLVRADFSDEEEDLSPEEDRRRLFLTTQRFPKKARKSSIAPDGSSWTFFTNLADLDRKVAAGRLPKRLQGDCPEEHPQGPTTARRMSVLERHNPAFVSMRKPCLAMETKIKNYYEPPLLSLAQQKVSNVFFAGHQGEYKLPERLPEDLLPQDVASAIDDYFNKTEFEQL